MSTTDTEYAALASQFGPGLSLQDMRMKNLGGPTTPGKSTTDLEYAFFAASGSDKDSRSDNEYKYWVANGGSGSGSMSDNEGISGGVINMGRTNLCMAPRAIDTATDGWSASRWFGSGTGTYSYVTGITGPAGTGITTARKKAWTAGTTSNGDSGFTVEDTNNTHFAVVPGETYTASAWMRHVSGGDKAFRMVLQFVETISTGTIVQRVNGVITAATTNTWYRVSLTATVPPGALGMIVIPDLSGGAVNWAAGDTLEGTGCLVEKSNTLGDYFDGASTDIYQYMYDWSGLVNESVSKAVFIPGYTPVDPLSQFPLAQLAVWVGDPGWVTGKPADGGLVSQIHNHGLVGGDLINAGGTERPTYKASDTSMNKQPSLQFGSIQILQFDINDIPAPYWMVLIGYSTQQSGTQVGLGSGVATSTGMGRANSNNQWYCSGSTSTYSGVLADALPHLLVGQVKLNDTWCQVDSVRGTPGVNAVNPASNFKMGAGGAGTASGSGTSGWVGNIAFVGIYTADPTLDPKWANVVQFAKNCGVKM